MMARFVVLFITLLFFLTGAARANNGVVVQLTGTISVQKSDGSVRILSVKSEIRSGDTLITQRDSYARIRFADGGEVTLKPNTSLRVERLVYLETEPREDAIHLSLLRGGARVATGLVGKRGSPDAYQFKTATGTISLRNPAPFGSECIGPNCNSPVGAVVVTESDGELAKRGSSFVVEDCVVNRCDNVGTSSVIVSVIHGEVVASNAVGFERFLAGESGAMEGGDRAPQFLLSDPGLQFTPPASFIQSISGGTAVNAGRNQECVVRR